MINGFQSAQRLAPSSNDGGGVYMAILLRYTSDFQPSTPTPSPCFSPKKRRYGFLRCKYHLLSTVAAMHPHLHLTGVCYLHTYTPGRRGTHPQREI
ncbi:hypothetical protein GHT06_013151 [Daphnia sinensis]|uniref:Uncharacterized protein n=1 Tax=Daphnia sinensis TaxID=1820382 RepID=A0AAD5PWA6_9CRUS|nr:hypothetical protein GHT06_013151 [Daphnia sinensis]